AGLRVETRTSPREEFRLRSSAGCHLFLVEAVFRSTGADRPVKRLPIAFRAAVARPTACRTLVRFSATERKRTSRNRQIGERANILSAHFFEQIPAPDLRAGGGSRDRKVPMIWRPAFRCARRTGGYDRHARSASRNKPRNLYVERLEDRLLLSAGDLDVVFGGGKVTAGFAAGSAQVHALAVEPDGRIIAVGQAGSPNATFALARFNRNGTLDQTFGNGGEVTTGLGSSHNGAAEAVAVQADGKIVV